MANRIPVTPTLLDKYCPKLTSGLTRALSALYQGGHGPREGRPSVGSFGVQ